MSTVIRPGALFDFDGTLVDSMFLWEGVDREYLARFGKEFTPDLQDEIEGMCSDEICAYFRQRYGINQTNEEMIRDWTEMSTEKYLHEVQLKPHVREYLEYLKGRGVRMAIATSTESWIAFPCLEANGIASYFDHLTSTSEVGVGKPDPAVYMLAARKLGMSARDCMAFEDVPAGILSAKTAGAYTIAVEDAFSMNRREEILRLADRYITDYSELIEYDSPFKNPWLSLL